MGMYEYITFFTHEICVFFFIRIRCTHFQTECCNSTEIIRTKWKHVFLSFISDKIVLNCAQKQSLSKANAWNHSFYLLRQAVFRLFFLFGSIFCVLFYVCVFYYWKGKNIFFFSRIHGVFCSTVFIASERRRQKKVVLRVIYFVIFGFFVFFHFCSIALCAFKRSKFVLALLLRNNACTYISSWTNASLLCMKEGKKNIFFTSFVFYCSCSLHEEIACLQINISKSVQLLDCYVALERIEKSKQELRDRETEKKIKE